MQTTPLHATHVALGARMVPFGGFDMPVQYTSILEEHRAVREAAGLFDVSHMGEVLVSGPQALAFVNHLVTNDAAKLYDGRAMYAVLCHPNGCAVDDLLVYRLGAERYLLVINASNIDKDVAHMRSLLAASGFEATLEDVSEATGLLALQGPKAFAIAQTLTDLPLGDLAYYHVMEAPPRAFLGCERALLSHTGYTGEPGLEIYCEADKVVDVWNAVMQAGAAFGLKPCGLGARDTLRLEAGYALYGHELSDTIHPLEAGLGWVVKLDKADFVGREALVAAKEAGITRRLVGFVMEERAIPRQGYALLDADGTPIGEVTSGTQSPTLGVGVGLGFVPNDPRYTTPGAVLGLDVRGQAKRAVVRKPPFHKLA